MRLRDALWFKKDVEVTNVTFIDIVAPEEEILRAMSEEYIKVSPLQYLPYSEVWMATVIWIK